MSHVIEKTTVYTQAFKRVLEYIEANLSKNISLDTLAHISNTSKYHFHRMFKKHFGESLSDYIKQRRLTYAAFQLADTNRSIEEIAFEMNYNSIEAFSRAFKKRFRVPPAEYRRLKFVFTNQVTTPINPDNYQNQSHGLSEIYFPETKLLGYTVSGYETGSITINHPDDGKTGAYWETMFKHKYPIKDALLYGVHITTSYKKDPVETFIREWDHFLGIRVEDDKTIPGVEVHTIPASKCLYCAFKGTHSEFNKYVDWLYEKHIPNMPYKIKDGYTFQYSAMGLNGELIDSSGFTDYEKLSEYYTTTSFNEVDCYSPDFVTHFFIPYIEMNKRL